MRVFFQNLLNPDKSPSVTSLISLLAGFTGIIIAILPFISNISEISETIETSRWLIALSLGGKTAQYITRKKKYE